LKKVVRLDRRARFAALIGGGSGLGPEPPESIGEFVTVILQRLVLGDFAHPGHAVLLISV
jgi:hypothetical protein